MRTFGRMKDRFVRGQTTADQPVPRGATTTIDPEGIGTVEHEAPLSESFELTSLQPADVTLDLVVQAIDTWASGPLRTLTAEMPEFERARLYEGLSTIRELATGRKGWA